MRIRQTDSSFEMLLGRYQGAGPDERQEIEQQIVRVFEEPLAILILDMSGFSRTAHAYGIIHFLSMIHEFRTLALPQITKSGGEFVKFIGDDILAVFDDVDEAYTATCNIMASLRAASRGRDTAECISFSCGIGFGPTIFVPGVDLWGNEANRAFKLGEDTANAYEVYLTEAAYEQLADRREDFTPVSVAISGLEITAYKTTFSAPADAGSL